MKDWLSPVDTCIIKCKHCSDWYRSYVCEMSYASTEQMKSLLPGSGWKGERCLDSGSRQWLRSHGEKCPAARLGGGWSQPLASDWFLTLCWSNGLGAGHTSFQALNQPQPLPGQFTFQKKGHGKQYYIGFCCPLWDIGRLSQHACWKQSLIYYWYVAGRVKKTEQQKTKIKTKTNTSNVGLSFRREGDQKQTIF